MRSLITGANGFVGTHLVEHLLARGESVMGCSGSGVWKMGMPEAVTRAVPLRTWNQAEEPSREFLDRVEAFEPNCIYHLAAVTVPGQCGDREPTDLAWRVNVVGTQRIADLAARLPVSPRIVFVSTCRVYGDVPADRGPLTEDSPLAPVTAYGRTKRAAEQVLAEAIASQGIDAVIIRSFQHAGPRQDPRLMLAEWCRQFAVPSAEPVQIRNMDSYLDFTDVRDVVRAYPLLAANGRTGEAYNVGCGIARRSGDLFLKLREIADPNRPYEETRPGVRREPIADITRLRETTGWTPQIPPEKTLSDSFAFWRAHANCWDR